jgi:hypothetical protein
MFSVCAVVCSEERESASAPKIFKRFGSKNGMTAVAQATFYPSNGRNMTKNGRLANYSTANAPGKRPKCQPYTCWDVLQWRNYNPGGEPIIYAPEWENTAPSKGPKAWDYAELISNKAFDSLDSSKVELSWEAMLTPVTKDRLERVSRDPSAPDFVKKAAKNAANHIEVLCN